MTSTPLTPAELQRRLQVAPASHAPLLVDLRSAHRFHRRHIRGSQNISKARLLSTEPPEQDLVLISHNGRADAGIADHLHNSGFHRRIEHLEGGLTAWQSLNLPLEGASELQPTTAQRISSGLREPWLISLVLLALAITLQQGGTGLLASATLLWGVLALLSLALHRGSRHLLRRYS